jgi:hypothetical protein
LEECEENGEKNEWLRKEGLGVDKKGRWKEA